MAEHVVDLLEQNPPVRYPVILAYGFRPMRVSLLLALASCAALLRVAGAPPGLAAYSQELLIASASAWTVACALFAVILLSIVARPRLDGLSG